MAAPVHHLLPASLHPQDLPYLPAVLAVPVCPRHADNTDKSWRRERPIPPSTAPGPPRTRHISAQEEEAGLFSLWLMFSFVTGTDMVSICVEKPHGRRSGARAAAERCSGRPGRPQSSLCEEPGELKQRGGDLGSRTDPGCQREIPFSYVTVLSNKTGQGKVKEGLSERGAGLPESARQGWTPIS